MASGESRDLRDFPLTCVARRFKIPPNAISSRCLASPPTRPLAIRVPARQEHQQAAILRRQRRSWRLVFEHNQLLTQKRILSDQVTFAAGHIDQCACH